MCFVKAKIGFDGSARVNEAGFGGNGEEEEVNGLSLL